LKVLRLSLLLLALMVMPINTGITADGRGTAAEAKAMLSQAIAHYRAVGRDQALADFTSAKAPFVDRDLYVFCVGPDRIISANGRFPSLVGVSANVLKDVDGNPLGEAIWNAASGVEEVSIRYPGQNPVSRKSEMKRTSFRRVGDDLCGVGVYDPTS
jgi:hypothetical protein